MRTYELMLILQPEIEEENLDAFVDRVQQVMLDNGGQVLKLEPMGLRELAYPIRKRQQGHYVLIQASLERPAILEVERTLKLSEDVLRYLLVRTDESN